ncbi:MAG TPA: bifunctional adenosylcobinamide kinase/adenosylcobinamide-phosphate guanylyltransferase [Nitrospira sp.]|nr:bifunctional adenosylcobinamide kinase/adenosylcobinamide-phosphate guanylyltransferase [Nitrospira sp.]
MSKATRSKGGIKHKRTGRIILVLGGAASGKSAIALRLAGMKKPKAFLATGQGLDDEMATRIARHQASRGSDWKTAEVPAELATWFKQKGTAYQTIVLDCVTLWLSNLHEAGVSASAVARRVDELLAAMRRTNVLIVIVTNELGLGVVPMNRAARGFRDLAGRVNQQIAAAADEVHLVVAGISLRLK